MVEISDPQGNITAKADISLEESAEYYETELVINAPQLWWVNGYGEQPLMKMTLAQIKIHSA